MDRVGRSVQQARLTQGPQFLVPSASPVVAVADRPAAAPLEALVALLAQAQADLKRQQAHRLPAQQAAPAKSLFVGKKG